MFSSNLTSILAYYAYIMLGLDFDSFMLNGGNPYYEAALNIVNTAQNENYTGWKSSENTKNRFWLLENITNPSYAGFRSFYYEYHLKGLDIMYETPEKGRASHSFISWITCKRSSNPGRACFSFKLSLIQKEMNLLMCFLKD